MMPCRCKHRRKAITTASSSIDRIVDLGSLDPLEIDDRAARPPLAGHLRIDPVAPGELSQARLTMLYRSTDRLRRGGAAMKNLAHSAPLHVCEKTAPSNPGSNT